MAEDGIDRLARKLAESVPQGLRSVRDDLEKNFRSVLRSGLDRLDLVTREEFEVQRAVLERTRQKLEALEARLDQMRIQKKAPRRTAAKQKTRKKIATKKKRKKGTKKKSATRPGGRKK